MHSPTAVLDRVSNFLKRETVIGPFKGCTDKHVQWQDYEIVKAQRAKIKNQKPICLWFTGLPGSGKTTIANLLDKILHEQGYHTYVLDGDNIRHGLNQDLDFSKEGRDENIRRIAEVARLMVDAGLIVITAFITPFEHQRNQALSILGEKEFVEVFIDTPLEECERRDSKGHYAKARLGEIQDFTGVSSVYETPVRPGLVVKTENNPAELSALEIYNFVRQSISGVENQ